MTGMTLSGLFPRRREPSPAPANHPNGWTSHLPTQERHA